MRTKHFLPIVILIAILGCSSNDGENCSKHDGTGLAASDWPKFRKDLGNTGQIDATIAPTQAESWVFPPRDMPAFVNAATSPVLLDDGRILVVANQGTFPTVIRAYVIDPDTGTEDGSFDISLSSIAAVYEGSTPVISQNKLAIMFTDGVARQFEFNGDFVNALSANGAVTGSLTVGHDGTLYTATTNGIYISLCANGGARWALGIGSSESSAAVFEGDPTTDKDDVNVIASNDGKVRAFKHDGDAIWTFTSTAAIRASVIYDDTVYEDPINGQIKGLVYGVDASGLVFVLRAEDGRRCRNLTVDLKRPVVASPAFAGEKLYVVDSIGVLHALALPPDFSCNTTSEESPGLVEQWTYESRAAVMSSPAVGSSTSGEPVIVYGANDGTVHAVVDQGTAGTALWTHCTQEHGAFNRYSPAIDRTGAVYVTTAAGRLYAIKPGDGTSAPCFNPLDPTPTTAPDANPSPSPTPTALP